MLFRTFSILVASFIAMSQVAHAEGELSIGLGGGFINTDLKALDSLIVSANSDASQGPITTSALGNGLEITAIMGYRFDGSIWAVHFQPTYYINSEEGTGQNSAAFKYSANSIVLMPMLRIYALENDFMHVFFQFGVGYGSVSGDINEGTDATSYSGSNLGYQGGVGLQMCYESTHCLNIEGNLRLMDIQRTIVDSSSSSGSHANGRVTQSQVGAELEVDGVDLGIDLSGFQAMFAYVFKY